MRKTMNGFITILLAVATLLFAFPKTVFADGGEGGTEKEVNGYRITLIFVEPVKSGENQFHIQITDAMGMPVTNVEVEVSAMLTEGMEMATEAPSVGVMTSNSSGMDMATEVPSTGVMKPNEPAADVHSEENITVMLEPTTESGEYAGNLSLDKSGEWMFNVHFTVNGETTEVDFPIEIARALGLNYAVLAGFLGINGAAIATAVILKRKSPVVRK
jgi:hypothetical protein